MTDTKADLLKQLDGTHDKGELLHQWGEKALKDALKTHFSAAYPELVDDLVRHHLSRYYLNSVTETLMTEGLVKVARVRDSRHDLILHHKDGLRLILENYAVLLSPDSTNKGMMRTINKKIWTDSFKDCHVPETELRKVVIHPNVLLTWEGFKAGMYSYALQVAGLIYLNSLNGVPAFWEEYQNYMKLIDPGNLKDEEVSAKEFEVKMELMMEAVVGYTGVVVTNP